MASSTRGSLSRPVICSLVTASGLAALSWEVLWQIKASLALGVSAWGTALTLAATMGGMSIGSLTMGLKLKKSSLRYAMRAYGTLEIIIGSAGVFLGAAFHAVEKLDTLAYAWMPASAIPIHLLGIIATIGIPTFCMGATLPALGLVARPARTSIATLYGLNTLGAAGGALLAALFFIPQFGITHTAWIIAGVNIIAGISAWLLATNERTETHPKPAAKMPSAIGPVVARWIVFITGFATFSLEVAWFRSLTAAFRSTTDAFAIMLSSVLLALGIAAQLVPFFRKRKISLGSLIAWAGILTLMATPLIERFDLAAPYSDMRPLPLMLDWFAMTFCILGPPVMLLGTALPWILDEQHSSRKWGMIYALNTFAAIIGAIGAAWVLLPAIGFARTSWLIGSVVTATGIAVSPRARRLEWAALGIAGLLVAATHESGVGRTRIQGHIVYDTSIQPDKILEFYEGPEATISAIEYSNGGRALVVDGFLAAGQLTDPDAVAHYHYMGWMGHLPMLAHPDPHNALVICFGTGQTANAVRMENPQSLDIVDINPRVFRLAHNFASNHDILDDPRVKTTVMDGRAYLRRTSKIYDVITLEPMPPNFAGVNALYSREFYELARKRLGPDGMIAQWVPFLHVTPHSNASIAKTFQSVFPNSILWVDPVAKTGILLGTVNDSRALGTGWPGFMRAHAMRDLGKGAVQKAVMLDRQGLQRYGSFGDIITDDNQLLAYGNAVYMARLFDHLGKRNFDLLDRAKQAPASHTP